MEFVLVSVSFLVLHILTPRAIFFSFLGTVELTGLVFLEGVLNDGI